MLPVYCLWVEHPINAKEGESVLIKESGAFACLAVEQCFCPMIDNDYDRQCGTWGECSIPSALGRRSEVSQQLPPLLEWNTQ